MFLDLFRQHTLKKLVHLPETCRKISTQVHHSFLHQLTLRPITLHGSCHVTDSVCAGIELCSIACEELEPEKLVQDWPSRVQVSGTNFSSVCHQH